MTHPLPSETLTRLRAAYSAYLSPGRLLLTGHSHQAWPDAARAAQLQAFDDAAAFVDDKWRQAIFPIAAEVGAKVLQRMGFAADDPIAFGESSHQLVYRLLSALETSALESQGDKRPRIVTTTAEFHSLQRQLSRLQEDGWEVQWVNAQPRQGLPERIMQALTPGTSMLALSAVLFEDAYVLPQLPAILGKAVQVGAVPLVDAYHAFNVVPLDLGPHREEVYMTAGGYKYAQFGNGLCWLRFPRHCQLRPRYTGWFADFASLEKPRDLHANVAYGPGGMRFAGSTFEASGHYRARAVLQHWEHFDLDVETLRAISTHQTRRLITALEATGIFKRDGVALLSSREDARRGGFVSVQLPGADDVVQALRKRQVFVDARGDILRLGPAPYLRDEDLDAAVAALHETLEGLGK